MAAYLDGVPFSGIIRIRDMMFTVNDPFRLDQGDVSFDAPDTVKSAMTRAIAENKTHYLPTTGLPRLRELIAAKLRDKNNIPITDPDDVLVTIGGIHRLSGARRAGRRGTRARSGVAAGGGTRAAREGSAGRLPVVRVERVPVRSRRARIEGHGEDAHPLSEYAAESDRRRADARRPRAARRNRTRARSVGDLRRGVRGRRLRGRARQHRVAG